MNWPKTPPDQKPWWTTVQFECTQGHWHLEKFWQRGADPDEVCDKEGLTRRLIELVDAGLKKCPPIVETLQVDSVEPPEQYFFLRTFP